MSDNSNQFSFGGSPPRALAAEQGPPPSPPQGSQEVYSEDDSNTESANIIIEETVSFPSNTSSPPQDRRAEDAEAKQVVEHVDIHDSDAAPRGVPELRAGSRKCSENPSLVQWH